MPQTKTYIVPSSLLEIGISNTDHPFSIIFHKTTHALSTAAAVVGAGPVAGGAEMVSESLSMVTETSRFTLSTGFSGSAACKKKHGKKSVCVCVCVCL